MFDIADHEQRELVALMARDELPTPDEATRAALVAAGVTLGPTAPGCALIDATLPRGWRKGAAEVSRAFWILDADGVRRFRVWWKAPFLFSTDPGSGGIEVARRSDGYARTWSADDSFEVLAENRRRFEIACRRCGHRTRIELSLMSESDNPKARARAEEIAEHHFARTHPRCPQDGEIAPPPDLFLPASPRAADR